MIERCATAYKLGSYQNDRFGSGSYGDLGALAAAILLDDETRQIVLDADPSHGHLREPLVKVISFFRGMGVEFKNPLHVPTLLDTEDVIGQGSYESPSVFSFFLPGKLYGRQLIHLCIVEGKTILIFVPPVSFQNIHPLSELYNPQVLLLLSRWFCQATTCWVCLRPYLVQLR